MRKVLYLVLLLNFLRSSLSTFAFFPDSHLKVLRYDPSLNEYVHFHQSTPIKMSAHSYLQFALISTPHQLKSSDVSYP